MSHHSSVTRRRAQIHVWLLLMLLVTVLSLAASPVAAPAGAPLHAMPPHPDVEEKIRRGEIQAPQMMDQVEPDMQRAEGELAPAALTGPIKALAVLVDFSDRAATVQASFFDSLIFAAPVAGRGSVNDYFDEVTYAQVDIVTVNLPSSLGWRRAPQTQSYYVNTNYCTDGPYPRNCRKLAEDIVDAVNGVVNFSQYDNNGDRVMEPIMIVHSGGGAEYTGLRTDIWSHSWSLGNSRYYDGVTISRYVIMPEYWGSSPANRIDMTIGVFAHEMGHGFWNLPDLYDRDGSSEGIGNWSLMAGGSWNGPSGLGASPAWPDAFSRIKMGYTTPTIVSANVTGQSIPRVSSGPTGTVFKLKNSVLAAQEYFLVENRQKASGMYDEYLPGSGLAIWHIDEAKASNQNDQECRSEPNSACGSTHYEVALEQADGVLDLENNRDRGDSADLFPGTTVNRTWNGTSDPASGSWHSSTPTNIGVVNISNPTPTMTADLLISSGAPPQPTASINDVSVTEGNSGSVPANFIVSLSSAATSPVSVNWTTANGSAMAGSDYAAASGTVSFATGESSKTVAVQVTGDATVEENEAFFVNLSNPTGATIGDAQGVGTITNDDVAQSTDIHATLNGTGVPAGKKWTATVTIGVHGAGHAPVAGAAVTGRWGNKGSVICTTSSSGTCTVTKSGLSSPYITFYLINVTKTGATYVPSANHNGTDVTIPKP